MKRIIPAFYLPLFGVLAVLVFGACGRSGGERSGGERPGSDESVPEGGVITTVSLSGGPADQPAKVMEIPYAEIARQLRGIDAFRVVDAASGEEVPYQLEYRGGEEPLNLLVQVNMPAGETLQLELREGAPAPVAAKTYARYVPERMDDFAWENDKIAFRIYGEALEGTPGDAHGIDVWVKRTPELVIDRWYESGDYHTDHGQGLDYYSVGLTLGAGDIAPYINGSLWFPKHYRGYKVLDNGPLRSTFRLDYEQWDAAGTPLKMSKLISLDAGSQLNRVEVLFESAEPATFPVAIGIVQRDEPGEHLTDKADGIMGYWEPAHGQDGTTGIGVVIGAPAEDISLTGEHLLGIVEVMTGEPLVYYTGAAWDKAGEVTSAEEWFAYLRHFLKDKN